MAENGMSTQPQSVPNTTTPAQGAGSIDALQCQWQGCVERATSAEQLYEHVCERHVGRKSTNNLNLTCAWGNCRTATVKRDHITSHIRVHVPLKPHKCDFCGKSFKRPQDLKKHVKTHADDSVIMQSPEPSSANRGAIYPIGSQSRTPAFYGGGTLQASVPMSYGYQGHANSQGYYAPTAHATTSAYGPVYYNTGTDIGNHASFDTRKRTLDALDEFFGDAKRQAIDTSSYSDVSSRLVTFQGLQIPAVSAGGMAEYQPAHMLSTGVGYGPSSSHGYALPPMSNLRTKSDLTAVDRILEQMTGTAYDHSGAFAQPIMQHHTSSTAMRNSTSPPGNHLQPHHHHMHSSAMSDHSIGTPELTPCASTVSYDSGHSPTSATSTHGMSPTGSGLSYPTIPSNSSSTMSNMGPISALGAQFDTDLRRRRSGGTLQKARPTFGSIDDSSKSESNENANDAMDMTPTSNPSAPYKPRTSVSLRHNIDPALAGTASSSDTRGSLTPPATRHSSTSADAEENWVENMRLLETLKALVRGRLERGEWDNDDTVDNAGAHDNDHVIIKSEDIAGMELSKSLYPVLKEVGMSDD